MKVTKEYLRSLIRESLQQQQAEGEKWWDSDGVKLPAPIPATPELIKQFKKKPPKNQQLDLPIGTIVVTRHGHIYVITGHVTGPNEIHPAIHLKSGEKSSYQLSYEGLKYDTFYVTRQEREALLNTLKGVHKSTGAELTRNI